jgi:hypothetical protein
MQSRHGTRLRQRNGRGEAIARPVVGLPSPNASHADLQFSRQTGDVFGMMTLFLSA